MIAVKDFGMFTDIGNEEVATIVEHAKANRLTWPETYRLLEQLAKVPSYSEVLDTMVRECVYDALGFYAKGEDFYGA
jgi:hypothetical protein